MAIKKALTDLPIKTSISGFYSGFSKHVTLPSKFIISMLILWAVVFPDQSGPILNAINAFILASFASWYIYVVAFFVVVCLGLALWPTAGRLNLGMPEDKPEFSNFS
jgi:choline/glycine/proline betaine transport protein